MWFGGRSLRAAVVKGGACVPACAIARGAQVESDGNLSRRRRDMNRACCRFCQGIRKQPRYITDDAGPGPTPRCGLLGSCRETERRRTEVVGRLNYDGEKTLLEARLV